MKIILSPSKTMDYQSYPAFVNGMPFHAPDFLDEAVTIAKSLKKLTLVQWQEKMKISEKLAIQNVERMRSWQDVHELGKAHPAIFSYTGEVYNGLESTSLTKTELIYAQDHLFILSAMYGALSPLSLVQPYRLEMGSSLPIKNVSLSKFWGEKIAAHLKSHIQFNKGELLVNLASDEYFSPIKPFFNDEEYLNIHFKIWKNNTWANFPFEAKNTRGSMAKFMISQKCKSKSSLEKFSFNGYTFNKEFSVGNHLYFTKK
jgi:uncharacterized protein